MDRMEFLIPTLPITGFIIFVLGLFFTNNFAYIVGCVLIGSPIALALLSLKKESWFQKTMKFKF